MKVFVTVGFQFPFDRLIKAVDQIAPQLPGVTIVAQGARSGYKARYIDVYEYVPPRLFNQYLEEAALIVSHAGMGTILTALERGKSILVMPRLTRYGEVTTEHQLASARMLEKKNYVHVAYNENELNEKLPAILQGRPCPLHTIQPFASTQLIYSIKSFMLSG